MSSALFFFDYFSWHYGRAFKDIFHVWANFFWFLLKFFSITLLLRTLFSPYKRLKEEHNKAGVEDLIGVIIVNTVMRILGALVRTVIIIAGLLTLLFWVFVLIFLFVFWLIAPFAIFVAFIYGINLFIV